MLDIVTIVQTVICCFIFFEPESCGIESDFCLSDSVPLKLLVGHDSPADVTGYETYFLNLVNRSGRLSSALRTAREFSSSLLSKVFLLVAMMCWLDDQRCV
jgi:hypothetical protein